METGPRFKVSSKRPEKRKIDLGVFPGFVTIHYNGMALHIISCSVPCSLIGDGAIVLTCRRTTGNNIMAMAYCACSRCGWALFGPIFSRLSPSLDRRKYWVKGPFSLKQPPNQCSFSNLYDYKTEIQPQKSDPSFKLDLDF